MNRESADALKSEILSVVQRRFGPGATAEAGRLVAVGIEATTGAGGGPGFRPAVRVQKRFLRELPELVEKKRTGEISPAGRI